MTEVNYNYLWNSHFSEQRKASNQLLMESVLESNPKGYLGLLRTLSLEMRFEFITDGKVLACKSSRKREY